MGRNSKAKRDAKVRARRQCSSAGPVARVIVTEDGGIFGGMAGVPAHLRAEVSTVLMLSSAWDRLDAVGGTCRGPLLVHRDGNFECQGGCDGGIGRSAIAVWHDVDVDVWPCSAPGRPQVVAMFGGCAECA